MKKLLLILSSISIFTSSTTTVLACDPVQQFPSKSATVNDTTLNSLFQNNNINLAYFDYLHYINGFFEHIDFEGSLTINKTSSPIVEISSEWEDNVKEYYDALVQIYNPTTTSESMNFTGLTYVLENIFIDDFEFETDTEIRAKLNSTMAVTVMKGWKTVGKLLLTVSNSESLSGIDSTKFINVWMSSIINGSVVYDETQEAFLISTGLSITDIINNLITKNNQLKGLTLTVSDFSTIGVENGFVFNGFTYKLI